MSELESSISQHTIHLNSWDVDMMIILTSEGPYFVIRELCGILGIGNVYAMINRMKEHSSIARQMRRLPVRGRGGRQLTWCIHRKAVAFWFATVQDSRCRPEVQSRLIELHETMMETSERILFGEVTSLPLDIQSLINRVVQNTQDIEYLQRFTLFLEAAMRWKITWPLSDDDSLQGSSEQPTLIE